MCLPSPFLSAPPAVCIQVPRQICHIPWHAIQVQIQQKLLGILSTVLQARLWQSMEGTFFIILSSTQHYSCLHNQLLTRPKCTDLKGFHFALCIIKMHYQYHTVFIYILAIGNVKVNITEWCFFIYFWISICNFLLTGTQIMIIRSWKYHIWMLLLLAFVNEPALTQS